MGRGRAQPLLEASHDTPEFSATDVDVPEASDYSTHAEVAVQATPTTQPVFDNDEGTGNIEKLDVETPGETQFPSGAPAHPVQVEDVTVHPVQRSIPQSGLRESATSQKFRDILEGKVRSPFTSPISSPSPLDLNVVDPVIPWLETLDPVIPFIETPDTVIPSIETDDPVIPSIETDDPVIPSIETVDPVIPLIETPDTVIPSIETSFGPPTSFGHPTPSRVVLNPSSVPRKPVKQTPSPPPKPTIYYAPDKPERSHSLITLHMDHIQGSKDPVRPSNPAAFVIPSELVAPVMRYIESRAKPGSDLSKITTDHPVVKTIVHGDARYRPQLPSWQSQQSLPSTFTMRDAFMRKVQRKRGFQEMEEETATLKAENAKLRAVGVRRSPSSSPKAKIKEGLQSIEPPSKRTKTVPDPYTADGQLILGRTKEIEVDEHGSAINPEDDPALHWSKYTSGIVMMCSLDFNEIVGDLEGRKRAQLEEARRIANVGESPYVGEENRTTDGPALGGLFAESQEQAQPEQVPETPRALGWGLSKFLPSARSVTKYIPFSSRRANPVQPPQPQQLAQTEPRANSGTFQSQPDPDVANSVAGPDHRHHQSTSNQQRLLTKGQSEEEKRIKRMRAQVRREAAALEKQKKDFEIEKKNLAEQQKSADAAQNPGQKRKRKPSPDVIPLPAGGGFGLVDEYFIVDSSSDEEDTVAQETPTKERPLKKARTSLTDGTVFGNPLRARPYTGTLFAHPDALGSRPDDNVFEKTPPPGPTLVFKVPSPGSSDSDDDDNHEARVIQEASSPTVPGTKGILRNSQSQPRPNTSSSLLSKTMAPPPRPKPSHAILPATTAMTPSGALEKAREKALKHQPKQPSTLRESSRLSTSTVNSDVGDEETVEEYDPAHPALLPFPSKAPVFGQPITPAVSAFGSADSNSAALTGFQQPVIQAASEQPHEHSAGPDTGRVQAEPVHDILPPPRANDLRSNAQEAVPEKKHDNNQNEVDQRKADMDAKVKADLDRWWKEHDDDYSLMDGYEEFEKELLAEEQRLMDGPNGIPFSQPHNIISAALDRIGADGLADRGIQTDIEKNWRPDDLERTRSDPTAGMEVFFNRLVKNGDIERDLADRVLSMGVPAGMAEYLAGQGVLRPVSA